MTTLRLVFSKRLEAHRGGYTGKPAAPQVSPGTCTNEHDGPTAETVIPPDAGGGGNVISECGLTAQVKAPKPARR